MFDVAIVSVGFGLEVYDKYESMQGTANHGVDEDELALGLVIFARCWRFLQFGHSMSGTGPSLPHPVDSPTPPPGIERTRRRQPFSFLPSLQPRAGCSRPACLKIDRRAQTCFTCTLQHHLLRGADIHKSDEQKGEKEHPFAQAFFPQIASVATVT